MKVWFSGEWPSGRRQVPGGRRPSGRLGWVLAILLFLLTAALGLAWWAAPEFLRQQAESRGSELLGREVRLQRVELGLFPLRMQAHGLVLEAHASASSSGASSKGSPAAAPLLRLERLAATVDAWSLWQRAPVVTQLEVEGLQVHVARTASGAWSVDDLRRRFQPAPAAPAQTGPGLPLTLRNGAVRGARLTLEDAQLGQRHEITDLQVTLPWWSNRAEDAEQAVQPRLSMRLNGAPVSLEAQAWPLRQAPLVQARLGVAELALAPLWPWLPPDLPLRPQQGRFSAELSVRAEAPGASAAEAGWQLGVVGSASLNEMALLHPGGAPMASWQRLSVEIQELLPLQQRVHLGAVRLEGAQLHVRREAGGQLEWASLGQSGPPARPSNLAKTSERAKPATPAAPAEPAQSSDSPAAWDVLTGPVVVDALQVHWTDQTMRPTLRASVNPLNLRVGALAWPTRGDVAFPFELDALLQPPDTRPAGRQVAVPVNLKGTLSPQQAQLAWRLGPVALAPWQPYLRGLLEPALQGALTASGELDWAAGPRPRLQAAVRSFQLDDFEARRAPSNAPGLAWKSLAAEGVRVDVLARRALVGQITWREPAVALRRGRDGSVGLVGWSGSGPAAGPGVASVPAASAAGARPADTPAALLPKGPSRAAAPPPVWRLELERLRMAGGRVDAVDELVPSDTEPGAPWALQLRPVSLEVDRLAWPPGATPTDVRLALQWPQGHQRQNLPAAAAPGAEAAPPASARVAGRLRLDAPGFQGTVQVERWPLHRFEPHLVHLGVALPVKVARAELGLESQIDVRLGPQGLQTSGVGSVRVADVRVLAASEGSAAGSALPDELAAWNLLLVQGLRWQVTPGQQPRVDVGLVRLSDFFARLQVTEAGRLNLQDVTAPRPGAAPAAGAAQPPGAAKAPPAGAEAAAGAQPAPGGRWPVDLSVDRTELVNGRVDFIDRFIRPNYAADLTELNGYLGRFESGSPAMAPVELRGRAARTALLEIRGAVNPTASPLMLDLSARATDLELAPLSPYGGKYVGYAIERGKLSVDLSYRIEADGKLEARNQIILNQLTFGERIESPSATSLPVRLALALLADRNGVIDVNLPVSGSINDPQFSVMGLVFRMIGNLLVKVVTAPFAWLAGSDTRDLSQIAFDPGAARLQPPALQTLDQLFKALSDRPRLRMTITGAADHEAEAAALRAAGLDERLQALLRREAARAGQASQAAEALPPRRSPAHDDLVRRLYADTPVTGKPRDALGMGKDVPVAEMEASLLATVPVNETTGRELALQRALTVRDALIARGLAAERLFLAAPQVGRPAEGQSEPQVRMMITGP